MKEARNFSLIQGLVQLQRFSLHLISNCNLISCLLYIGHPNNFEFPAPMYITTVSPLNAALIKRYVIENS